MRIEDYKIEENRALFQLLSRDWCYIWFKDGEQISDDIFGFNAACRWIYNRYGSEEGFELYMKNRSKNIIAESYLHQKKEVFDGERKIVELRRAI